MPKYKISVGKNEPIYVEAESFANARNILANATVQEIDTELHPGDILVDRCGVKYMLSKIWVNDQWEGHFALILISTTEKTVEQYSRRWIMADNKQKFMVYLSTVNLNHPELCYLTYTGKNILNYI